MSEKYAITFLCMLKHHYVVGAIIAAYIHKCFITKLDKKIDLIIMCDSSIYDNYGDTLKLFFDQVKLISLDEFSLDSKYQFAKEKYQSWVSFATNKWKCLKFDNYDKVLFMDIDILPCKKGFYDIFKLNTPAVKRVAMLPLVVPKCGELINGTVGDSFHDYVTKKIIKIGSLDGGLVLLNPSKDSYRKYRKFTKKIFDNGIYSSHLSFPDETSLFYYLFKTSKVYSICDNYLKIPWDVKDLAHTLAYNFNSFVKPWIKGRAISWDEELLWHDIYDTIRGRYNIGKIDELYNESIKEHYTKVFLILEPYKQKKRYYCNDISKINPNNVNTIISGRTVKKYGILDVSELKEFL